eukprot:1073761-Alexandrium_andersonii.AAC.1
MMYSFVEIHVGSSKQIPHNWAESWQRPDWAHVDALFQHRWQKTAGHLTHAALALAWALLVRIAGWSYWHSKRAAVERRLSASRCEATRQATKRLRTIWRPGAVHHGLWAG